MSKGTLRSFKPLENRSTRQRDSSSDLRRSRSLLITGSFRRSRSNSVEGYSVIGANECKSSKNCSVCECKFSFTKKASTCQECTLSVCKAHIMNVIGKKRVCDLCYKEHLAEEAAKEINKTHSLEYLEASVETRINEQEQWQEINADIDASIIRLRELLRSRKEAYAEEVNCLRQKLHKETEKNERFLSVASSLQIATDGAKKFNSVATTNLKNATIELSCLENEHAILLQQRGTLQQQAFTLHFSVSNQVNFTQVFMSCCRICKKKFAVQFNKELAKANFSDNMSFLTNSSVLQARRKSSGQQLKAEYCKCNVM